MYQEIEVFRFEGPISYLEGICFSASYNRRPRNQNTINSVSLACFHTIDYNDLKDKYFKSKDQVVPFEGL